MKPLLIFLAPLFLGSNSWAQDKGFRYEPQSNTCRDTSGKVGLNPNYLGECGNLVGQTIAPSQNVSGNSLKGADLTNAVLNRMKLARVRFDGAILVNTKLMSSDLADSVYIRTKLVGTDFSGSNLERAKIHSNAKRIILRNTNLKNAAIEAIYDEKLPGSEKQIVVIKSDFSDSELSGASLSMASFPYSVFKRVKMVGGTFDADVPKSDFTDAHLENLWIHGDSSEGIFKNTVFKKILFGNSHSFAFADLRGARFEPDLSDSYSGGGDWEFAIYDSETKLPFDKYKADFSRMQFVESKN